MNIAVLKETRPDERRVALVPGTGKKLIQLGYSVSFEAGAADLVFRVNAPPRPEE